MMFGDQKIYSNHLRIPSLEAQTIATVLTRMEDATNMRRLGLSPQYLQDIWETRSSVNDLGMCRYRSGDVVGNHGY